MIARGDVAWADAPTPLGSEPGFRRPVLVLQSNQFNQSGLSTVIVVGLSSNLRLSKFPGNVVVSPKETGLPQTSVINVTQILAIDRNALDPPVGRLSSARMQIVEQGVKLVLDL